MYLLHHLRTLTGSLARMQETLQPTLERLAEDAAVTQAELERVSAAAERLGGHEGDSDRPDRVREHRPAPEGTWDE